MPDAFADIVSGRLVTYVTPSGNVRVGNIVHIDCTTGIANMTTHQGTDDEGELDTSAVPYSPSRISHSWHVSGLRIVPQKD